MATPCHNKALPLLESKQAPWQQDCVKWVEKLPTTSLSVLLHFGGFPQTLLYSPFGSVTHWSDIT